LNQLKNPIVTKVVTSRGLCRLSVVRTIYPNQLSFRLITAELYWIVYVEKRENPIVNRLNKTKVEKAVDHEQEKQDRLKAESTQRRAEAIKQVSLRVYEPWYSVTDSIIWCDFCRKRLLKNSLNNGKPRKQQGRMICCPLTRTSTTRRIRCWVWTMTLCKENDVYYL
jgi:hypothetical protein